LNFYGSFIEKIVLVDDPCESRGRGHDIEEKTLDKSPVHGRCCALVWNGPKLQERVIDLKLVK
jgi:hypothetical protein